jgi:type VII secretion protein EccB
MTMQSRRDLFHAHRLMTQRASLALLRGEPDIPDQPLRRLNVGTFSGVLVAVIVTALFVIWGLLGHGGGSLQYQPGLLALDKQTGQPYVFCQNHEICPVLNYTSARLALGNTTVTQQTVSQASLAKFRRGPLIGIPGLPPLPVASQLVRQPWSVCTQTALGPSGTQTTTTVAAGLRTGGSPMGGRALLAQARGGQDWVIWHAQRMMIQSSALSALATSQPAVPVPGVWLDALPEGPAFAPPAIPGHGATVTGPLGPVHVGQVYQVTVVAGSTQYYVMLRDGLAPVSKTQAALLNSEPGAPKQATLPPSDVSTHRSASSVPSGGLPATVPAIVAPGSSAPLCVVYSGGGPALASQVETGGRMPPGGTATGNSAGVTTVALPAGAGALVADAPGTDQATGAISYSLVVAGRRYALASKEVAGMLGYNLSQAAVLPAGVVDLVPSGPALDPAQAARPVPGGG